MSGSEVIVVDKLYKSFLIGGKKTMIIEGLSFILEQNKSLIIKGPSGSGKTTILRILLGLLEPDAGTVRVLGKDPLRDPIGVRQQIGYLPQNPLLIPQLTVWENLLFYLDGRKRNISEALSYARRVAKSLNIEYLLGEYPTSLSAGELRRAELMLALSDKPPLLLLDEPTAMIDSKNVQRVIDILKEAKQWASIVMTTHDPRLDVVADTVIELG